MLQTRRSTGFIAIAGLLCTAGAFAGAPPSGAYRGLIGELTFASEGGRVVGRYEAGGPCSFDAGRPLVDGELEGEVLVATVTLCQVGPACEERAYPVLAFRHPDGTLSGNVKLEPGCQSPALEGTRLLLRASKDDPSVKVAAARKPAKKTNTACIEDIKKASLLVAKRDYAGASHYFSQGLVCNDRNWAAHLGRGVAELKRGNPDEALVAMSRARDLVVEAGGDDASIHFNLACVHARMNRRDKALAELDKAVLLGWADPKSMVDDPDLAPLRDDPAFKQLVDRAWDQRERQPSRDEAP